MAPKKFAIIGTSSAGKTTLVYDICARLKLAGVLVDSVLQQDRRFSFDRARLEDSKLAQYSFIANQIKAECDMSLRPGVEVLVSDRSPLDFYAYYEWQYGFNDSWWSMVFDYCYSTFDRIYYVDKLPYENDGARLSEAHRDQADFIIRLCIDRYNKAATNPERKIKKIERNLIYADIVSQIGKKLPEESIAIISKALGENVLIGGSYAFNRATKFSDVDVYLLGPDCIPFDHPSMIEKSKILKDVLGVKIELRTVNKPVWDYLLTQNFREYEC